MKHMAQILLLASGSVLLSGCVEDDAYYTTSHEHQPHYHTGASYVSGHHDSQQIAHGPIAHGPNYEPQPLQQPVMPATGYQVEDNYEN
jgi:hypothetical protein